MIYFDNAATSFPKPPSAIKEALYAMKKQGGNAGRGAHRLSLAASEKIYTCRERVAALLGIGTPARVIFTGGTTLSLNMAIKGLVPRGAHVLLSELEHNATRRPVHALSLERDVTYDTFPVLSKEKDALIRGIRERILPHTAAIICTHASNICSVTLPLAEIGALCREKGLLFIVDAAQSAGHLPIDMQKMGIHALAVPAHKGLLGIQGCGILALAEGVLPRTIVEGGSGVRSLSPTMPEEPPERYEAGTLPLPAICALSGGISFLEDYGVENLEKRLQKLFFAARERLESVDGIEIYQKEHAGAVLLFNKSGISPVGLAATLDKAGIAVRAGLHCAPLAHRALGTPTEGAVRISFGPFNTVKELDRLRSAVLDLPTSP